jgi:Cu2+-containing amine oxidase
VSSPPITVCESGHGVDVGSFLGVAAERLSDRIILTSQMSAGWYRYTMKWALFADGRIDGWFGFSAVTHNCVNFDHTHHNYWRLDFDIDGAADDAILIGPPPDVPLPPGPLVVQGAEAARAHSPALTWMVKDMATGRGYRLLPGPTEVVDEFSVADVWLMRYNANEITDAGQSGPACAIKFNNFVNQQALEEEDVVMWVRGGAFHAAGDLDDCQITSFTLQPAGDWSPSPPGAPVAAPRPGTR